MTTNQNVAHDGSGGADASSAFTPTAVGALAPPPPLSPAPPTGRRAPPVAPPGGGGRSTPHGPAAAPARGGVSRVFGAAPDGSAMLRLPFSVKSCGGGAGASAAASAAASRRRCFTWSCSVTLKSNLRAARARCRAREEGRAGAWRGARYVRFVSLDEAHAKEGVPARAVLHCVRARPRSIRMCSDGGVRATRATFEDEIAGGVGHRLDRELRVLVVQRAACE